MAWVPLDTAWRSIWVHRSWFEEIGRSWVPTEATPTATDGHEIAGCGNGDLKFDLRGTTFMGPVQVAGNIPSKILMKAYYGTDADSL